MAKSVSYVVTGHKELDDALNRIEPNLARKVLRKALRVAIKPIQKAAVEKAPVRTGATKAGLKIASKGGRGRVFMQVKIGDADIPVTVTKRGKRAWYPMVQEFGAKKGSRFIAAKHYLADAYAEHKASSRATAIRLILEGVSKEVSKIGGSGYSFEAITGTIKAILGRSGGAAPAAPKSRAGRDSKGRFIKG